MRAVLRVRCRDVVNLVSETPRCAQHRLSIKKGNPPPNHKSVHADKCLLILSSFFPILGRFFFFGGGGGLKPNLAGKNLMDIWAFQLVGHDC